MLWWQKTRSGPSKIGSSKRALFPVFTGISLSPKTNGMLGLVISTQNSLDWVFRESLRPAWNQLSQLSQLNQLNQLNQLKAKLKAELKAQLKAELNQLKQLKLMKTQTTLNRRQGN